MTTTVIALAILAGCNDSDGPLRIEIRGEIVEPDGTRQEFFGRGYSTTNDAEYDPSVSVRDWKSETDGRWEVDFSLEHGQLSALPPGASSWDDGGELGDGGPLGMHYLQDQSDEETTLYYTKQYALDVESLDESTMEGTVEAAFSNGATLSADLLAKGLKPPSAGSGSGDTGDGTGPDSPACANYNDTTPYYDDIQIDSECWTAGLYRTCEHHTQADAACANVYGLEDCCYTGSGSCPYC